MKMNVFVVNDVEDKNESGLREAGGHRSIAVYDPEDEIVQGIDEQRVPPEKSLAVDFLAFLNSKQIDLSIFQVLTLDEQQDLKREFFGE